MEAGPRRIEIFAPFGAAMDLAKAILFQPFDLAKWCVIGFAAFLANLGGFYNSFNYNPKTDHGDWTFRSATHGAMGHFETLPGWLIAFLVAFGAVLVVLVIVLMWVGARGKFIFTDCVVRNRGAIVEPWHEYRREGNSLFLFRLAIGLVFLVLLALASLPLWWPLVRQGVPPEGAALVTGIAGLGIFGIITLAWVAASAFMVPIMYRRRCSALQGLRESVGLIMDAPGPVILFFLFAIVLFIAGGMIACLTTCLTCCIAAIPYVGTVLLLPLYVFLMSYLLLFVRQFGPDYDAWAVLPATEPVAAPPIQSALPPADAPPVQD